MRAARAMAQRRAAPASHRGFAAGDGAAPPSVASGAMHGAVGLAAGGLFIGVGVSFAGALLRDGLTGGGETLGDRVKDGLKDGGEALGDRVKGGLKEGGAYLVMGAALSSSVAGLFAAAVACGARLLRTSQAEPAGGKALPGPQCAGAA